MQNEELQLVRKVFHCHQGLVKALATLSEMEGRSEAELVRSYLYPVVMEKIKQNALVDKVLQAGQPEHKRISENTA